MPPRTSLPTRSPAHRPATTAATRPSRACSSARRGTRSGRCGSSRVCLEPDTGPCASRASRWRISVVCALAAWALLAGCVPSHSMPASETRRAYVEAHPEVPAEVRRAILGGRVILGMRTQDVQAAWGLPSRIRVGPGRTGGFDEQWLYAPLEHRTPIGQRVWSISFRNGIVACIHTWMAQGGMAQEG
jgi:hypothetical protein